MHDLNRHPGDHPNSPAWLLWHTGREIDVQLAELDPDYEQIWYRGGYRAQLDLGPLGDSLGYAQRTPSEHWEDIIDYSWEPPVSRGTRLVSIVDDACQHVAQLAYICGMPEFS